MKHGTIPASLKYSIVGLVIYLVVISFVPSGYVRDLLFLIGSLIVVVIGGFLFYHKWIKH